MISVLVLTHNEEVNLPRCLGALEWADDVLVIDSHSTDNTVQIANHFGARVLTRPFDNFASQRNFGLSVGQLRHEWVLHLDADEVVTPDLRDEMFEAVQSDDYVAYKVASKLIFQNKWLRHAGMFPSYQVRLGRREELRFEQSGHGQRESNLVSRVGVLEEALLHYSFEKGVEDWFDKHNRYSTDEAVQFLNEQNAGHLDWGGLWKLKDSMKRRRALKQLSHRLPFRPSLRFLYAYVLRLGFLDGRPGYTYCRMLALYQYLIDLKVRELKRSNGTSGKKTIQSCESYDVLDD